MVAAIPLAVMVEVIKPEVVAPVVHSVIDTLVSYGVLNTPRVPAVNNKIDTDRISDNIFNNDLNSCINIKMKELDDDFKTYLELTVNEG